MQQQQARSRPGANEQRLDRGVRLEPSAATDEAAPDTRPPCRASRRRSGASGGSSRRRGRRCSSRLITRVLHGRRDARAGGEDDEPAAVPPAAASRSDERVAVDGSRRHLSDAGHGGDAQSPHSAVHRCRRPAPGQYGQNTVTPGKTSTRNPSCPSASGISSRRTPRDRNGWRRSLRGQVETGDPDDKAARPRSRRLRCLAASTFPCRCVRNADAAPVHQNDRGP